MPDYPFHDEVFPSIQSKPLVAVSSVLLLLFIYWKADCPPLTTTPFRLL